MKKIIPVLLLASIIFLAGCISKTIEGPTGAGLEISLFSAPPQVDSGDTFSVDLVVQNTGGNVAKDVEAKLMQKANFELLGEEIQETDLLLPPVQEKNVPGEEFFASWQLTAPSVPSDQVKSVAARITYDYSSNATSNIYVVPKEQYEEMGREAFQTYSTSTKGPVLIRIQPLPAFKIRSGQDVVDAIVVLTIEDVGGGYVPGKIENFKLMLTSGKEVEDKTDSCRDVSENGEIELLGKDRAVALKCEFPLDAGKSAVSYVVDASADYTYYIDTRSMPITVRK